MNIILFGFKGSGKTTLGKQLSHALQRPFIDTDDRIRESYEGLSISEIYQTLGASQFRALERKVIHSLQPDHSIIALGGGAILDPDNVRHLQSMGQLIYLKASFDTIQKRVFKNEIPSFVDSNDPIQSLQKLYEQRLPIYESIEAHCINVDTRNTPPWHQILSEITFASRHLENLMDPLLALSLTDVLPDYPSQNKRSTQS